MPAFTKVTRPNGPLYVIFQGADGALPEQIKATDAEDAAKVAVFMLARLGALRAGDSLKVVKG